MDGTDEIGTGVITEVTQLTETHADQRERVSLSHSVTLADAIRFLNQSRAQIALAFTDDRALAGMVIN